MTYRYSSLGDRSLLFIQAVLRTAECLGILRVWIVNTEEGEQKLQMRRKITRGNEDFLQITDFESSEYLVLFSELSSPTILRKTSVL
jgi:hypothetical protein